MSLPLNRTSPSTRAPGTVSCMRLRQRSSVDLPQPDGPMIAVTRPVATAKVTSRTTRAAPKYASSDSAAMQTERASGMTTSISAEAEAGSRCPSRGEADDEDESEEDEGSRPGLRDPFVVRCIRIGVDLHG